MAWLLLLYRLPAEPSRKRVTVWRNLKRLGALYLEAGGYLLPHRPETLTAFAALSKEIRALGGRAELLQGELFDGQRSEALVVAFCHERDREYQEVLKESRKLLHHVQEETAQREFTFPEVEELESDLEKLKRWAKQVRERDYFGAAGYGPLLESIAHCEAAISDFLEATFQEVAEPPTAEGSGQERKRGEAGS